MTASTTLRSLVEAILGGEVSDERYDAFILELLGVEDVGVSCEATKLITVNGITQVKDGLVNSQEVKS